jgi:multicomponent Na+:H+ antiporter subunit D
LKNIILPLVIPLLTAVASIIFRKNRFRDYIGLGGITAYAASVAALAGQVLREGAVSIQAGGWQAPYGITLIADELSVLMLCLTATVSLAAAVYSWGYISDKGKKSGFYGFLGFMVTGMTGAFITGDLFNLFVMFELVLMSSYALVAFSGSRESLFISLKYVVLNLIGSSLMLVAIGGLYSVTGTLNLADMAQVLSTGSVNMAPVLGLSSLLFCVFAIKSGLVPFHFWAPPVYSNSPPPASALMAGISKKVGIYAVIRIYLTVFSHAEMPATSLLFSGQSVTQVVGYMAGAMAVLTVLLGGISAVGRKDLDKLLSYSSLGQIGFIFVPLSIAMIESSSTALIAALTYLVAHALAKPALFMVSGVIKRMTGTSKLSKLGGLSETSFTFSASVFILLFSLVGVPPLLGFFGKFLVFEAVYVSGYYPLLLVLFAGALTTIIYVSKAWLEVFFGEAVEFDRSEVSKKEVFSITVLAILVLVLGAQFEPVYQFIEAASETALSPEQYIDTVLGDAK